MEKKVYINLDMNMYVCVYIIYIYIYIISSKIRNPLSMRPKMAAEHVRLTGTCATAAGATGATATWATGGATCGATCGATGATAGGAWLLERCCASRWRGAKPRAPVKWRDNGVISGNLTACYGKSPLIGEPSIL